MPYASRPLVVASVRKDTIDEPTFVMHFDSAEKHRDDTLHVTAVDKVSGGRGPHAAKASRSTSAGYNNSYVRTLVQRLRGGCPPGRTICPQVSPQKSPNLEGVKRGIYGTQRRALT